MKKIALLFLIISITIVKVFAQIPVQGRVLDFETNEPIPNASVYFNNTEIGMKTNNIGAFRLYPKQSYKDLIISAVGYEKVILNVKAGVSSYTVLLKSKANTLNEVSISADRNAWRKWGDLFSKLLLGNDVQYRGSCKILNPKDVIFYFDKDEKTLEVSLKRPLIVKNSDLSYNLSIDIDTFRYSFEKDELLYKSTIQYEEISNKKRGNVQITTNYAYYGSKPHFYKSLYTGKLEEEGFTLSRYWSVKNEEKERVYRIIQLRNAEKMVSGESRAELSKLSDNIDSAIYYKQILDQSDNICWGTKELDVNSILTYDSVKKTALFKFGDSLILKYKRNNILLNKFTTRRPPSGSNEFSYFFTILFLIDENGIEIDSDGFANSSVLKTTGDLGDRRFSRELPLSYDPYIGRKLY